MNLCSDSHDEICFEGRKCPFCEFRSEMFDDIEKLQKVLLHLKEQVQKETAERCAEIAGSLRFDTRVSIDFLWMKDKQISLKKNNEEIGKATAEAIRREFLDA